MRDGILAYAYALAKSHVGAADVDGVRFESVRSYGVERCAGPAIFSHGSIATSRNSSRYRDYEQNVPRDFTMPGSHKIALSKSWPTHIKSAMLHGISRAQFARLTHATGRTRAF